MEIKTSSINLITTGKDGGRDVLLIGIKEAYRGKPQYQRYLRQEFARGKDLDNANIFKYLDLKEIDGQGLCIETEWEDSRSLAQWLKEGHSDDEKKRVVRQVASAISAMHSSGIINGCLNLHNIFITKKGDEVKLLTVRMRYADSLSQPNDMLRFLAPEAKDGTVGLDARADIYSLGVMLKEMGFMPEYHNVIERCCRFGRNERFDDVDSFLEAIDRRRYSRESDELSGESASLSTNKKMAVILAVIVVLIGAAVALFVAQNSSSDSDNASQQSAETEQTDTTPTEAQDMDSTAKTQPVAQPVGNENGAAWQGDEAFLNDLVPQMQKDLDKIYASDEDPAVVRRKVQTYYKGLRRVLKKQGKKLAQLDAFDKAFADYLTKLNNQADQTNQTN